MRELSSIPVNWRRLLVAVVVVAIALVWLPAMVSASVDPAGATNAVSDAAGVAASGEAASENEDLGRYKEEPVPGGVMLLIAYMVMWGLAIALVIRLLVSQSKLEAQITELEERVGDDDSA